VNASCRENASFLLSISYLKTKPKECAAVVTETNANLLMQASNSAVRQSRQLQAGL